MFEVNLVPDIKAQLLKKEKLRNLIVFVSIVVAAGAGAVTILLGAVVTAQNIAMAGQDNEIKCRSVGPERAGECKNFGTAVMRIANLNDYLTIQDQMSKISTINENRMLLSRVFGVLDVILPTGEDVVVVSELAVNLPEATLSFDAQGDSLSGIDYRALEVFKNTIRLSYYDHGRYMRYDAGTSNFVEIPTTCITETVEGGVVYGIYHKGAPGCEAPILSQRQREIINGVENDEEEETSDVEVAPVMSVKIKRVYRTQSDKDDYMAKANETDGVRYYFESACVAYDGEGKFDETTTRETCQLAEVAPAIRDSSNGRDSEGNLVLRFSAAVILNREVFRFVNKHMQVIGPTRQNVTDSYTQIRNMFAERATECDPDDKQCLSQEVPNGDN